MNIPDKRTDLEDNRNARSFLKSKIQTESAGFFNGLLKYSLMPELSFQINFNKPFYTLLNF